MAQGLIGSMRAALQAGCRLASPDTSTSKHQHAQHFGRCEMGAAA